MTKELIPNILFLVCFSVLAIGGLQAQSPEMMEGPFVRVTPLTEHTYVHTSLLDVKGNKVACNGLVYIRNNRAFVFDTPATVEAADYLIDYIRDSLKAKVVGVSISHFHDDALGGLDAFKKRGIHSYSNNRTIPIADDLNVAEPQFAVPDAFVLPFQGDELHIFYPGSGHTTDNTVAYVASDSVLFGGCLVKAYGGTKGNLDDAVVKQWPISINTVQDKFPDVQYVVPGHGKPGGPELLEFTKELFQTK